MNVIGLRAAIPPTGETRRRIRGEETSAAPSGPRAFRELFLPPLSVRRRIVVLYRDEPLTPRATLVGRPIPTSVIGPRRWSGLQAPSPAAAAWGWDLAHARCPPGTRLPGSGRAMRGPGFECPPANWRPTSRGSSPRGAAGASEDYAVRNLARDTRSFGRRPPPHARGTPRTTQGQRENYQRRTFWSARCAMPARQRGLGRRVRALAPPAAGQ